MIHITSTHVQMVIVSVFSASEALGMIGLPLIAATKKAEVAGLQIQAKSG